LEKRVDGNRELISEILRIFFDRYPEVIARVRQAVVSKDSKGLERAAHSLRGYLVHFHAKRAAEIALELEINGCIGEVVDAEENWARLEHELDLLMPLLVSLEQKLRSLEA
jgi:HPt (histidine-containing phosphotransfer) domain-containing protein